MGEGLKARLDSYKKNGKRAKNWNVLPFTLIVRADSFNSLLNVI